MKRGRNSLSLLDQKRNPADDEEVLEEADDDDDDGDDLLLPLTSLSCLQMNIHPRVSLFLGVSFFSHATRIIKVSRLNFIFFSWFPLLWSFDSSHAFRAKSLTHIHLTSFSSKGLFFSFLSSSSSHSASFLTFTVTSSLPDDDGDDLLLLSSFKIKTTYDALVNDDLS